MAFASLLAAALCWTPPARPPTFTRRELGSLAGLAAASSGGVLLPASAGGIPPQPYEKQPGFKLNTGQAFPTASFGLQVYDDATAQKLTSLALEVGHRNLTTRLSCTPQLHAAVHNPSATRLGHTPWPHLPSSLSHTPTPAGRLPQLLRLRARQEPGRLRTRHQGEWRRRPVNQPARPPAPKSRGTPAGPGAKPRRLRSCHAAHAAYERPGDEHVCSCLPWYGAREASAPAALQRHLGQRHPLASRRRARGPLHLRLGPIQPREWKGGCTRSLRARMPREHGSLVRHTPELQPQASKQGPRQLCHSHA
jgi:hypothetical protein